MENFELFQEAPLCGVEILRFSTAQEETYSLSICNYFAVFKYNQNDFFKIPPRLRHFLPCYSVILKGFFPSNV